MSKYFDKVIGTDPSGGMIQEARSRTNQEEYPNVDFVEASAESLPFAADHSVDMVVAGQAAHWFDFANVFAEMKRVLKRGGVMAFWGYGDQVMVNYPKATRMITEFYYRPDKRAMGPYWQQPGRSIVQDKLRAIQPPDEEWEVERVEYEPGTSGPHSYIHGTANDRGSEYGIHQDLEQLPLLARGASGPQEQVLGWKW